MTRSYFSQMKELGYLYAKSYLSVDEGCFSERSIPQHLFVGRKDFGGQRKTCRQRDAGSGSQKSGFGSQACGSQAFGSQACVNPKVKRRGYRQGCLRSLLTLKLHLNLNIISLPLGSLEHPLLQNRVLPECSLR